MALTVEDALKLPCLRDAKLVAGKNGLGKVIACVSVSECKEFPLDLRIMGKHNLLFREQEFYITSGYAIKDEPELLLDTIKLYSQYNSSGMCITNRYFSEISPEVIEYANAVNYPLISFRRETRYSDIIMEITKAILLNDKNAINETIVDEIRERGITARRAKMLAYKLNSSFQRYNHAVCVSFELPDKLMAMDVLNNIQNTERIFAMLYQNYFIVFFSSDKPIRRDSAENNMKYVRSILKNAFPECNMGAGGVYDDVARVKDTLEEAIISCEVAKIRNSPLIRYDTLGTYKFLMHLRDRAEMNRFYNETLQGINEQSPSKREELMNTMSLFVHCDGDVQRMSKEAFQHVNTIRYRIGKLKSLMGMEESELEFITTVSLIYKIGQILEKEPEDEAENGAK